MVVNSVIVFGMEVIVCGFVYFEMIYMGIIFVIE